MLSMGRGVQDGIPRTVSVQFRNISEPKHDEVPCKYKYLFPFIVSTATWINQSEIHSERLDRFREVSWFTRHGTPNTTHPSPEDFWQKTAERIFYLDAYVSDKGIGSVFHFENDVLLYGDLNEVINMDNLTVTPMSSTHTTFAFVFIPNNL